MLIAMLGMLTLALLALGGICFQLHRRLQQQALEQGRRDAQRDARLRELNKRLDAYLTGSIRMGEELEELRRTVAPLPDKLTRIEQRDPSALSFTQAARLVGLGASSDDITQACGLSKAEAELVAKLHQSRAKQS